jgi:hypothetical protein
MRPTPSTPYYQPSLPLPKKSLWDQLPEATRLRCRQALAQLLRQVAQENLKQSNSHERKD